ncbi:MAG: hypothetical protein KUG76_01005 [Gammaproteobacteria bacterium]|nr:hypothetical protein [Gammaproteobacteria bacterium]
MKVAIKNLALFGLCCIPAAPAMSVNDTIESECYQSIVESRDIALDTPSYTIANGAIDSTIIAVTGFVAIPTLAAAVPAGVVLVAGHSLAASAVKESKIGAHERLLALLKEAAQFEESGATSLKGYPSLKELWLRVNGPIFKKITPQQVASSVLKAEYDIDFCTSAENYRLVHFKDYVLDDIKG